MKTMTYDGSLTGGADEINSYRVVVTDEQSATVADTGYVTGYEMVLSDIVPDEYTFTVQGAIQGGGNCIVVAESVSQVDVSSNNIGLVLSDPAPGVAGEISLRVYAPLDGEYSPESASITIEVGDFSKTLTAVSGNGLTFAGSGEDDFGAYWDFSIAESAAIPTGACIITLTVQSNEGSTPVKGVVAGVLFPYIGIKGVIDSKTGLVNNEFRIDWQYMDTPDFYEELNRKGDVFFENIKKAVREAGKPWQVNHIGSLGCIFFTDSPVENYAQAKTADTKAFAEYFSWMLGHGIYVAPSQFEAMFLSSAMTEEELTGVLETLQEYLNKNQA